MASKPMKLEVVDYGPGVSSWKGYVQPPDKKWILYVHRDGTPVLFPKRKKDGAVVGPSCNCDCSAPKKGAAPKRKGRTAVTGATC